MKPMWMFRILLSCPVFILAACTESTLPPLITSTSTEKVNTLSYNPSASCSSDENPFYSCVLDASFPYDVARDNPDMVEISFGQANGDNCVLNPEYRSVFNLYTYPDALFTNFMTTSISYDQFDTIKTDYLIQQLTPGDYALPISGRMNCVFFRCENGTYGLLRIGSVIGDGTTFSPEVVSFEVKYVLAP